MQLHLPVARVGEIAPGSAKSFRFGVKNGIAFNDNGTIIAFENFCTHSGGQVDLHAASNQFVCRLHGACFDVKSGERLSGQAPENTRLKPISLIEKDGMILAILEINDGY
ncbi:Rieske (2Fe-2S) protein [Candidatus Uhrbacteria bacterium]|nr:Rieske (2Fe-2S) protein [Candidatus Uhrbacteria bacterium]